MRISDWSSPVCSSDLPLNAICRLGRPWHHALAVDDRRRPGERIAAQRAARRFGHESERDETDETREDHIIGRHELIPRPADQRAADRRCGPAEDRGGDIIGDGETREAHRGGKKRGEGRRDRRSEEHTSELQSLMRISYAAFCLTKSHQYRYEIKNKIRQSIQTR